MNENNDMVLEGKVIENALNELIHRWVLASYDERTVINGLLSSSINLTFRMCFSHQDALDMINEHVTDEVIKKHQSDQTESTTFSNEEFPIQNVPHSRFRSPFCEALNRLEPGQSIGNLTKEQTYKYRPNFYTKYFADRKFSFKLEGNGMYRIWRIK